MSLFKFQSLILASTVAITNMVLMEKEQLLLIEELSQYM